MDSAQPDSGDPQADQANDPVLERRRKIQGWVTIGQRIGYTLFGIACVAFFAGFFAGFDEWVVNLIVAAIVVGSFILAPAIVFGYGVKSADRADREGTWGEPNP